MPSFQAGSAATQGGTGTNSSTPRAQSATPAPDRQAPTAGARIRQELPTPQRASSCNSTSPTTALLLASSPSNPHASPTREAPAGVALRPALSSAEPPPLPVCVARASPQACVGFSSGSSSELAGRGCPPSANPPQAIDSASRKRLPGPAPDRSSGPRIMQLRVRRACFPSGKSQHRPQHVGGSRSKWNIAPPKKSPLPGWRYPRGGGRTPAVRASIVQAYGSLRPPPSFGRADGF